VLACLQRFVKQRKFGSPEIFGVKDKLDTNSWKARMRAERAGEDQKRTRQKLKRQEDVAQSTNAAKIARLERDRDTALTKLTSSSAKSKNDAKVAKKQSEDRLQACTTRVHAHDLEVHDKLYQDKVANRRRRTDEDITKMETKQAKAEVPDPGLIASERQKLQAKGDEAVRMLESEAFSKRTTLLAAQEAELAKLRGAIADSDNTLRTIDSDTKRRREEIVAAFESGCLKANEALEKANSEVAKGRDDLDGNGAVEEHSRSADSLSGISAISGPGITRQQMALPEFPPGPHDIVPCGNNVAGEDMDLELFENETSSLSHK